MFNILVLLFICVPLIEIIVLIKAGALLGVGTTILLIIVTALLGATLARAQGLETYLAIQRDLAKGMMPTERLMDGLMIFLAGVVLLTPGFVTDAVGFFILWPTGRNWLKQFCMRKFSERTGKETYTVDYTIEDE